MIVLKISSYWAFHSVSAIIKYFITILTVNEKCTLQSRKKRPVGKKTPLPEGFFCRRPFMGDGRDHKDADKVSDSI